MHQHYVRNLKFDAEVDEHTRSGKFYQALAQEIFPYIFKRFVRKIIKSKKKKKIKYFSTFSIFYENFTYFI